MSCIQVKSLNYNDHGSGIMQNELERTWGSVQPTHFTGEEYGAPPRPRRGLQLKGGSPPPPLECVGTVIRCRGIISETLMKQR